MKIIVDEFSALAISRQRRYQLRRERDGLCRLCGNRVAEGSAYCPTHLTAQRRLCSRTKSVSRLYNPADLI